MYCITAGGRAYYSTVFGGHDPDKRRRVIGVLNNDTNVQSGSARIERRTVAYGPCNPLNEFRSFEEFNVVHNGWLKLAKEMLAL